MRFLIAQLIMTKIIKFIVFISFILGLSLNAFAQEGLQKSAWVNDPEHYLTATEKNALEEQIQSVRNDKAHNQIAIVILKHIDSPLEEEATKLFRTMGIGEKNKDNGILLLIAVADKKYRIEVGYGLEGVFPDGKVGRFGRDTLVPLLQDGKIYNAAQEFVNFVSKDTGSEEKTSDETYSLAILLIVGGAIIVLAFIIAVNEKINDRNAFFMVEFLRAIFNILFFVISIAGKGKGGFGGGSSGGGGASGRW